MKLLTGNEKPQRRIIIENEHLLELFDILQAGLAEEVDGVPIPVDFEEVVDELDAVITGVAEAIIDKIASRPFFSLTLSSKTFEIMVEEGVVSKELAKHLKDNSDEINGILAASVQVALADAIKSIIDELLREAELFNLKKLRIKTRKHVIAIC